MTFVIYKFYKSLISGIWLIEMPCPLLPSHLFISTPSIAPNKSLRRTQVRCPAKDYIFFFFYAPCLTIRAVSLDLPCPTPPLHPVSHWMVPTSQLMYKGVKKATFRKHPVPTGWWMSSPFFACFIWIRQTVRASGNVIFTFYKNMLPTISPFITCLNQFMSVSFAGLLNISLCCKVFKQYSVLKIDLKLKFNSFNNRLRMY